MKRLALVLILLALPGCGESDSERTDREALEVRVDRLERQVEAIEQRGRNQ